MLFVMLATWLILSGNPYLGIVIATIGACWVSVDAFVKNIDELDQYLQQIVKGSDPSNYSPVVYYFSTHVTHIRNVLSFAEAKVSDCDFGSVDPLKQTLSA